MLTEDELRQAFLDYGPVWIRTQAVAYAAIGGPLPEAAAVLFRPFFGADVDRARVAVARIDNPPFYRELLERGADPRELLNFPANLGGITFDTTIIVGPHVVSAGAIRYLGELLFHELVHVVQYRLLGVDRFSQLYVDGWLAGRARFRDDPLERYRHIPLEAMAFELQGRFAAAPAASFSVEAAVRAHLGL